MQLLIGRFVDARARDPNARSELLDCGLGQRRVGCEGDRLQPPFDLRELRLESRDRLAEDADPLEQPDDISADPRLWAEIDDLDWDAAADAVQAPDPLLHRRRVPRQVVEHEAMAELEVAPLSTGLGRHEETRPVGGTKPRHFSVPTDGRQSLVEHPARELPPDAERIAQHLERLAMGN